jgi:hypothetical protein
MSPEIKAMFDAFIDGIKDDIWVVSGIGAAVILIGIWIKNRL